MTKPYPHESFCEYYARRNGTPKGQWYDVPEEQQTDTLLRFMDTMADFTDGLKDRVGNNEMAAALSRGGGHGY